MNIIFIATYLIWFASEILLARLLRSKSTDKQDTDKNSLSLIWITVITSIFIAVVISMKVYMPIYLGRYVQYVGLAIILVGIVLRLMVVVSLGTFFTVDVTIRENHRLKKDGFYKYLRHPSYFASLLSFMGLGISLNNWMSFILITVAIITVFSIRIKIEEKLLITQFGPEYLEYKKATSGFIPFIR